MANHGNLLFLITAVCSGMLDNVTTVLLVGPMTLAITNILKVDPVPYIITQIMASNIGGTATLIGDPPNIMIGSAAKIKFRRFYFKYRGGHCICYHCWSDLYVFYIRKKVNLLQTNQLQRLCS